MRKRIGLASLAFLFALASTYAQTTNFFELARTGTPQDVQAAIDKGATAFDLAQYNYYLKGTDAYRQLQEASQ